jgi:uncharacterized iron-regulated membrane protein
MALAALLMPFFFVTGIVMWMQRRANERKRRLAQGTSELRATATVAVDS